MELKNKKLTRMKKILFILLFFCPFLVFGQRVTPPYYQDFEDCLDNSEWETGMSGTSNISKCGMIFLPSGITQGMVISSCAVVEELEYATAEGLGYATLKLDLTNSTNTFLDFKWKWTNYVKNYSSCWDDDYLNGISGIYISDNDGASFAKIYTFMGGLVNPTGEFISVELDLSTLAAQNNIEMNDQFVLRIQCYSLYSQSGSCMRDFGIDDINIYDDCVPSFTFSNTNSLHNYPRSNGYYEVSDFISAGPNVQIQPGTRVTFNAGNSIKLNTGFRAMANSDFKAYLGGCTEQKSVQNKGENALTIQNESQAKLFKVYPNPSKGAFTVEYQNAGSDNYVVYNSNGQVIRQGRLIDQVTSIDLTGCPKGLYIIKINIPEGSVERKLFIE